MKTLDYMNQFISSTVSAANVVITLLTCHRCYEDWRLCGDWRAVPESAHNSHQIKNAGRIGNYDVGA